MLSISNPQSQLHTSQRDHATSDIFYRGRDEASTLHPGCLIILVALLFDVHLCVRHI